MRDAGAALLARRVDSSQHIGINRRFYQRFEKFNRRLDSRCRKLLDQVVQSLPCAVCLLDLIMPQRVYEPARLSSLRWTQRFHALTVYLLIRRNETMGGSLRAPAGIGAGAAFPWGTTS